MSGVSKEYRHILDWVERSNEDSLDDMGYANEGYVLDFEEVNAQLYDLIVSKTEGGAITSLRTVMDGNTLQAWKKLFRQFGESTVQ